MVNDEIRSNPVKPDSIVICSSAIKEIYEDKEKKEGLRTVSTDAVEHDGYLSTDLPMSIKLEGEWTEKADEEKNGDNDISR